MMYECVCTKPQMARTDPETELVLCGTAQWAVPISACATAPEAATVNRRERWDAQTASIPEDLGRAVVQTYTCSQELE